MRGKMKIAKNMILDLDPGSIRLDGWVLCKTIKLKNQYFFCIIKDNYY